VNDSLRGVNLEGERHLILDNSGTVTLSIGNTTGKGRNAKIQDRYRRSVTAVRMSDLPGTDSAAAVLNEPFNAERLIKTSRSEPFKN
jgi:hypothetical protein